MPKARNALYAQSGGVTSVINTSACGVIETARKHKRKIARLYAARDGIIGALTEDLIDTGKESMAAIRALRHTPGGAFGSCRYKLKGLEENRPHYERLIEVFKAHDIGYFFYNGGGDSADTCLKVAQLSQQLGYPLIAVHVPKTVDNDLPITDNCPGFGSVAKYIAVSIREASLDVASMARTSTKVFVLEAMGRHAGWIAAAGGIAADKPGDPPHIILLPEIPFDQEKFLGRVDATVKAEPATRSVMRSSAASGRWWRSWLRTSSVTSITGRSRTTCSARHATSPRRSTSSRRTPSAAPRLNWRSRAKAPSCQRSCEPQPSHTNGRLVSPI
jgi:6-phosphofructokinase